MDFSVLNGYYGVLMEGTKYKICTWLINLSNENVKFQSAKAFI